MTLLEAPSNTLSLHTPLLEPPLADLIIRGGFSKAVRVASKRSRRIRARDYLEAIVRLDVRGLARIQRLDILIRLLELAASQTARLFNLAVLASPFSLSRPTIGDYVTLLEQVFQFHHFRDKEAAETDAVLDRAGRRIAGVEVKLSGTVVAKDFCGVRRLRHAAGKRFATGVVL